MTVNLLEHFLLSQLGAFLMIFARVGAAVMFLPIFGDSFVPPRLRLLFALAFSLVLTPVLIEKIPPLPGSPLTLGIRLGSEILIGIFIGMIARTLISVLHVAGTMIAYQSSLAVSSIFDPVTGAQTAVPSNFLSLLAVTVMLAMNLHHHMLAAAVQSYTVFNPGEAPMLEDMLKHFTRLVADCFTLGIIFAAPHIAFSLIFYLIGGLMARLMPNFQVFYLMMAPLILVAFVMLWLILPTMMHAFINFATDQLMYFAGGI